MLCMKVVPLIYILNSSYNGYSIQSFGSSLHWELFTDFSTLQILKVIDECAVHTAQRRDASRHRWPRSHEKINMICAGQWRVHDVTLIRVQGDIKKQSMQQKLATLHAATIYTVIVFDLFRQLRSAGCSFASRIYTVVKVSARTNSNIL